MNINEYIFILIIFKILARAALGVPIVQKVKRIYFLISPVFNRRSRNKMRDNLFSRKIPPAKHLQKSFSILLKVFITFHRDFLFFASLAAENPENEQ